ncbi:Inosine/uridine-preferring nucleoside hydrolase domain-containing protein [Cladochytrium replicatum]|nr:Inosine/uridine-preferring nucleoside hydrolase domain-containing protein [Cladochytrium replicatum]
MVRRVLIDTDGGIDDAASILISLLNPDIQVDAICIVRGNVDAPDATRNVDMLINLAAAASETPKPKPAVFVGADAPLVPHGEDGKGDLSRWVGHGGDGLGNLRTEHVEMYEEFKAFDGIDRRSSPATGEHAAMALVRMVNERPGEYTLLTLGPLTNIAIAISLDTGFLRNVKQLVMMGGCLFAQGNSNRSAEFNVYCDPEAAEVVFHSTHLIREPTVDIPKIVVVPWETTIEGGLPWDFFDLVTNSTNGSRPLFLRKFLRAICHTYERVGRPTTASQPSSSAPDSSLVSQMVDMEIGMHALYRTRISLWALCDVYAVAALVGGDAAVTGKKYWREVHVELEGTHGRGLMALDWFAESEEVDAVMVVVGIDREYVKKMYLDTFVA